MNLLIKKKKTYKQSQGQRDRLGQIKERSLYGGLKSKKPGKRDELLVFHGTHQL
jgi:hypothetical protein